MYVLTLPSTFLYRLTSFARDGQNLFFSPSLVFSKHTAATGGASSRGRVYMVVSVHMMNQYIPKLSLSCLP